MKKAFFISLQLVLVIIGGAALGAADMNRPLDYTGRTPEEFYEDKAPTLVLLNYWATYCVPCKEEMKALTRLYSAYRDRGLLVIGASVDASKDAVLVGKVAASLRVEYPVLYGLEPAFRGVRVTGLPTTFLLDAKGRVLEEIQGKRSYEVFSAKVAGYIAEAETAALASPIPTGKPLAAGERGAAYSITARRLPGSDTVELRLTPTPGYYLNGPGYPPLTVRIERTAPSATLGKGVEAVTLQAEGVPKGGTKVWKLSVPAGVSRLTGQIVAVVCSESLCRPIKEAFTVELR